MTEIDDYPALWEQTARATDTEREADYRARLDAAFEKLLRSQEPGRRRMPAFSKGELSALLQFVRKHY